MRKRDLATGGARIREGRKWKIAEMGGLRENDI